MGPPGQTPNQPLPATAPIHIPQPSPPDATLQQQRQTAVPQQPQKIPLAAAVKTLSQGATRAVPAVPQHRKSLSEMLQAAQPEYASSVAAAAATLKADGEPAEPAAGQAQQAPTAMPQQIQKQAGRSTADDLGPQSTEPLPSALHFAHAPPAPAQNDQAATPAAAKAGAAGRSDGTLPALDQQQGPQVGTSPVVVMMQHHNLTWSCCSSSVLSLKLVLAPG